MRATRQDLVRYAQIREDNLLVLVKKARAFLSAHEAHEQARAAGGMNVRRSAEVLESARMDLRITTRYEDTNEEALLRIANPTPRTKKRNR